jgi:hypothetical protein
MEAGRRVMVGGAVEGCVSDGGWESGGIGGKRVVVDGGGLMARKRWSPSG